MPSLPDPDERIWLIRELSTLVRRRGIETFLLSPIREPSDRDFPDPWTPDLKGLERLCLRLLGHAGMKGYRVSLERFEGDRSVDSVDLSGDARYRHRGAAAWYAGLDGRRVRFGCSERQLAEGGEGLVGVMAHEVAHAWREANGLVNRDPEIEERLTDLTTIWLGFGVFTVNNTHRYRTGISERGAQVFSVATSSSAGYLSPQSMSFLFALQLRARGVPWSESRHLIRLLEPNQRGYVRTALRALPDSMAVRRSLETGEDLVLTRGRSPAVPVVVVAAAVLLVVGMIGFLKWTQRARAIEAIEERAVSIAQSRGLPGCVADASDQLDVCADVGCADDALLFATKCAEKVDIDRDYCDILQNNARSIPDWYACSGMPPEAAERCQQVRSVFLVACGAIPPAG